MSRFILLIILAGVVYIIYFLYLKNMKKPSRQQLLKMTAIAIGLLFILMVVMGRAPAIFAAIGALLAGAIRYLPILMRHWPTISQLYRRANPNATVNNNSKVKTPTLVVTLNHTNGHMDGEIISGSFAGRNLSELSIDDLKTFYRFCQANDSQATQILEAYIQRERIAEWQDAPNSNNQTVSSSTSEEEAYDILGLQPGATKKQIVDAHRRLMSRMHPDKGGSNYLAAKINTAKKTLLKTVA